MSNAPVLSFPLSCFEQNNSNYPVAKPEQTVLDLLEEDDEFEEFEGAEVEDQGGDEQLWQDDW